MTFHRILFALSVAALAACGGGGGTTGGSTTTTGANSGTTAAATSHGATSAGTSAAASSSSSGTTTTAASTTASGIASSSAGTTGAVASSATAGTTGATSGGATSGTTTSGTATTSGAASSTSGTTGSSAFAWTGTWYTNWAVLTLAQTGTAVTGSYVAYGWPPNHAQQAGTIAAVATGDGLSGTATTNDASLANSITFTYQPATQSFTGNLGGTDQWCGVQTGPLPSGCGWSGSWTCQLNSIATDQCLFTQTGDLVTASYSANFGGNTLTGGLAGAVADYRLNGYVTNGSDSSPDGRVSLALDPSGTTFSGNVNLGETGFCGATGSAALPAACVGGGDLFDGVYYTNFGTVNLTHLLGDSNVSGLWWSYGDPHYSEHIIGATASGTSLGWFDPLFQGDCQLTSDYFGGLSGTWSDGGVDGQWCGLIVNEDLTSPVVGELPSGCGFAGSWSFWGPSGATGTDLTLSQIEGAISGPIGGGLTVDGHVAVTASPPYWEVTGTITDGGATATAFAWFPSLDGASFSGDLDGGTASCGAQGATEPSPCLE